METIVTEAQNCRVETMLILILEMIAPLLLKQQFAQRKTMVPLSLSSSMVTITQPEQNRAAYYNSAYTSSRG